MNPQHWSREHQIAAVAISIIGALIGSLFAWLESPIHTLVTHELSGPMSDYTAAFSVWLFHAHYWPWPLFGFVIAALAFYAVRLFIMGMK